MSNTTRSSFLWGKNRQGYFSIHVPDDGTQQHPFELPSFACTSGYCAVQIHDTIHVYSLPDFVLQHTLSHQDRLTGYHLSYDLLVTRSSTGRVRVWDLLTGKCRAAQDFGTQEQEKENTDIKFPFHLSLLMPKPEEERTRTSRKSKTDVTVLMWKMPMFNVQPWF
ncbi:hypothetical protein CVT26_014625 [Gymnopilus dilepis]|uniref:Uncharacterized protein n=1 Tax=Gymnopilus dilepis TaxID=231916 RepID=A0A409VWP1_9AGAR|nr:hypothetical protein CVT26_014625 [Gymnopilus dilepis]